MIKHKVYHGLPGLTRMGDNSPLPPDPMLAHDYNMHLYCHKTLVTSILINNFFPILTISADDGAQHLCAMMNNPIPVICCAK